MMMVATLVLCAVSSVHALDGVLSVGGTYRYGHVYWRSDGDVTEFTVEAAFKRHIEEVSSWSGTAVDNLAKVADWNDFFDNMNARVDAPRWGKKNMIIDNIEDIEPCRVDCDRDGGDDLEDFDFFHDMLTLNDRGHIVDNLDDIDACTIDC